MSVSIVPTVTAYDLHDYREQLERVTKFASRVHIDLMDGIFAPTKSPAIDSLWFPQGVQVDVHVMFRHPDRQVKRLLEHNPSLVIVQTEADQDSVRKTITGLKKTKVRVGVAILADTLVHEPFVSECIRACDYVLIFSGHLGFHGGTANTTLLEKVPQVRALNPNCEIAWDGGLNVDNVREIADAGVTVLNVGGEIQKADDPQATYKKLCLRVAS